MRIALSRAKLSEMIAISTFSSTMATMIMNTAHSRLSITGVGPVCCYMLRSQANTLQDGAVALATANRFRETDTEYYIV
eukprot:6088-Heterococcus_DN1.PRE.4